MKTLVKSEELQSREPGQLFWNQAAGQLLANHYPLCLFSHLQSGTNAPTL